MPVTLEQLYNHHRNGSTPPTLDGLVKSLKGMITSISKVYIVIDALDECSECNTLLDLIDEITKSKLNNLHMLLTSRKEEELNRHLRLISAEINLESSLVDDDITFHIHAVLHSDRAFSKWPEAQKLEIETSLTKSAHGM